MKQEQALADKYVDALLDICHARDEFTTSDLQGVIGAQVKQLIDEAKRLIKE